MPMSLLREKIDNRHAHIGVIGLGYVGLPLAVELAREQFKVTGFDIDPIKVNAINNSKSYIGDISDHDLARVANHLRATADFSQLNQLDCISICVPTPLGKTKDPDISFILEVKKQLQRCLHNDILIILESTTYPGTTEEIFQPLAHSSGLTLGQDFFLAFSPERIDPGNTHFNVRNTPKVVGGMTPQCTEMACALYSKIVDQVVPVSSTRVAEMVKILENTYRAVNIGLVNEVAIMCRILGIDTWEVIDAAATKPFGFTAFYPGPGLGGHCIPVDPHYLSWKLKTLNYQARFIDLAAEINTGMPLYVVTRIADILNDQQKSINGARILILGIAYKPNVADTRESPALDIFRLLQHKNASVRYCDPYCPEINFDQTVYQSELLTPELLHQQDLVVITTAHSQFDFRLILEHSKMVFDTRNALSKQQSAKLVRL